MNISFLRRGAAVMALCGVLVPGAVGAMSAPSVDFSGYSVEQLEELLVKLQKSLAEKKKGSACFVSNAELSLGDGEDGSAEDVRRLQEFLLEKGYFGAKKSTGYFGKVTRASLQAFQKAQGVSATGVFDASTRAKAHGMNCTKMIAKAVKEVKKEEKKVAQSGEVKGIMLKTSGAAVYWQTEGYSKQGFKLVWSKNAGPTYPMRESGDQYQYFDRPEYSEAKLWAFDGAGTYYVRVCEYLGGKCGVYSNEVKVELK